MTGGALRRLLNLVLPVAQPLVGSMAPVFGIGHSMAEMSARSQTPVTPAGYAFSIWFVIFALGIAWGIWQVLPANREAPLARRLGWPLAAAFACSNLWMLLAAFTENGWHLVAILLLMVLASLTAFFIARRDSGPGAVDRWLIRPFTGLMAGWVSIALFANIAGAAMVSGLFPPGDTAASLGAVFVLLAAGGLALGVLWASRGSVWYAAAVAWALLGIILANTVERDLRLLPSLAALALLVVVIALAWQRGRMVRPA